MARRLLFFVSHLLCVGYVDGLTCWITDFPALGHSDRPRPFRQDCAAFLGNDSAPRESDLRCYMATDSTGTTDLLYFFCGSLPRNGALRSVTTYFFRGAVLVFGLYRLKRCVLKFWARRNAEPQGGATV